MQTECLLERELSLWVQLHPVRCLAPRTTPCASLVHDTKESDYVEPPWGPHPPYIVWVRYFLSAFMGEIF